MTIRIDNVGQRVGDTIYFGDENTDGSWRIVKDGDNLSFERREGGAWVSKGVTTP